MAQADTLINLGWGKLHQIFSPPVFEQIFDNVLDLYYPSSGHSLTWDSSYNSTGTGQLTHIRGESSTSGLFNKFRIQAELKGVRQFVADTTFHLTSKNANLYSVVYGKSF